LCGKAGIRLVTLIADYSISSSNESHGAQLTQSKFDIIHRDGYPYKAVMLESVRQACEMVCEKAQYVRINRDSLESYATSLAFESGAVPKPDPRDHFVGSIADTVAFVLTLDSVNFGSGYFPHLLKRENMSGYFTIASALKERFLCAGPFSAVELIRLGTEDCACIFSQDLQHPARRELMELFARALNDLGNFVLDKFAGRFLGVTDAAKLSAASLVQLLSAMPFFQDRAYHNGIEVPFYKRAQITVADLAIRFAFQGPGLFEDLDRLTIFADNVIPNVLRVDGILSYEESLAQRIRTGELIPAGSAEEIEIRASAVSAAELMVRILQGAGRGFNAMTLDFLLWNRGQTVDRLWTDRDIQGLSSAKDY
jgi:hypothetical protein